MFCGASKTTTSKKPPGLCKKNQVRRIMVLNEANELVGITSLGELATVTGNRLLAGETLESVSEDSRATQKDHSRW